MPALALRWWPVFCHWPFWWKSRLWWTKYASSSVGSGLLGGPCRRLIIIVYPDGQLGGLVWDQVDERSHGAKWEQGR